VLTLSIPTPLPKGRFKAQNAITETPALDQNGNVFLKTSLQG